MFELCPFSVIHGALLLEQAAISPGVWALLLGAAGVFLLVAELGLPTHGIVGVMGVLSILAGVGACFFINAWLGLGILLALVAVTPFAWMAFVNLWPRTPMGKRLVLSEISGAVMPSGVRVGQVGVTVTELRPWGECEFDGLRVEATSEYGIIGLGKSVRVIALTDGRAVVREINEE
jgi:membrane-bound serine protease (ClpP class)